MYMMHINLHIKCKIHCTQRQRNGTCGMHACTSLAKTHSMPDHLEQKTGPYTSSQHQKVHFVIPE